MAASPPIRASVLTLSELFGGAYRFHLPSFQRAYGWGSAQVSRLVTDLVEASRRPPPSRHFLGRLLLARPAGQDAVSVIDGHQRLMTLTILFAVLRDLDRSAPTHAALKGLVAAEPAADSAADTGGAASYRLRPHPGLAAFLAAHVQADGATSREPDHDADALSETEANVITNRDHLRRELIDLDGGEAERASLARFLCTACLVEILEVDDEGEAWSMLQTEEQTRLDFSPTDRARASLLSAMPPEQRQACGSLWEAWEQGLGSADLRALLGHIRTLELRKRSDVPVETELIRTFSLERHGAEFFRDRIAPRADVQMRLRARQRQGGDDPVGAALARTGWIDQHQWMPSAIHWVERRGREDEPASAAFFTRLERLVWMLRIGGVDPQVQQTRMLRLIGEIDQGKPAEALSALLIERKLVAKVLESLRSRTFYQKPYRGQVLRRLCLALAADPGPLDAAMLTIEHILPRNPPPGRAWWGTFKTKAQIQAYANRLGNLVLLPPAENQRSAARDYVDKRPILAASPLALTQLAAAEAEWSPATIERRTQALIALLFQAWQLDPPTP